MPGTYHDLLAASFPELGDQAESLLAARSTPDMEEAAHRLRALALSVRRLLASSASRDAPLVLNPSAPDPELCHAEIADLAVDVVTAVDYLLNLLDSPVTPSPRMSLAGDARSGRGYGQVGDDAFDWLIRKRLDARGAAVRVGARLIDGLLSDIASNPVGAD
jgi:hypothetical protein